MSNCLLSIGGAGHRSTRPLVFLAAAGALGDEELALLIVDNDSTNGNLTDTVNLIHLYNRVQGARRWLGDTPFFRPRLNLLDDKPWTPFAGLQGVPTLDQYLGYESMRASDRDLTALYEFLYDEERRGLAVSEGFRGKPSIGAAIYRAAARTPANGTDDSLRRMRQQLENGTAQGRPVKLFSMGSIFGGTGAAGLPSIPLSLVQGMGRGAEHVLCGAALLLPYFSFNPNDLDNDGAHANPSDFIMMMKDALRYYELNPSRYQCVYAVGADQWRHIAKAAVGKKDQKNEADLVEFLAALAASNFFVTWKPSEPLKPGAEPPDPELYVLHRESQSEFKWSDVPERERIEPKLAALTRFCFLYLSEFSSLLENGGAKGRNQVWFNNLILGAHVNPATNEFQEQVLSLKVFCEEFLRWWTQLHQGASIPLNLVQTNAFAAGQFHRPAFSNLVSGQHFSKSREEAVKQLASVRPKQQPDLTGLGHFARALARVAGAY